MASRESTGRDPDAPAGEPTVIDAEEVEGDAPQEGEAPREGEEAGRRKRRESPFGGDFDPRTLLDGFKIEVDPERIDESVRNLTTKVRELVDQGRYTKVRIKYKGKPLMKDIPLGVFVATEAITFWYAGLLRALVVNLGVRTVIEVELVHDATEKVEEGIARYMDGEVEEAEALYREALRMKPGDPAALYNLGVLLRVTGRRKEAIEALEKAAAATDHPDAPRAREVLEKLKRGPRTL